MTDEQKAQIIEHAARKRAELDRQRWPGDIPPWDEMTETMRRFRLDDAALYAEAFGLWDYVQVIQEQKKSEPGLITTASPNPEHWPRCKRCGEKSLSVNSKTWLCSACELKEALPCATASK